MLHSSKNGIAVSPKIPKLTIFSVFTEKSSTDETFFFLSFFCFAVNEHPSPKKKKNHFPTEPINQEHELMVLVMTANSLLDVL